MTGNLQKYYMSQAWWHTGEAEAGGSQVQRQPGLYSKILLPKKEKKKNDTKIVKAKSVQVKEKIRVRKIRQGPSGLVADTMQPVNVQRLLSVLVWPVTASTMKEKNQAIKRNHES
jgi:hypothetical protein